MKLGALLAGALAAAGPPRLFRPPPLPAAAPRREARREAERPRGIAAPRVASHAQLSAAYGRDDAVVGIPAAELPRAPAGASPRGAPRGVLVLLAVAGASVAALGKGRAERAAPRPALPALSRRALLFAAPAVMLPAAAHAAATGGGFVSSQIETLGGGPPKFGAVPPLTKGEPKPEELKRLVMGYKRLDYLLANWEKETTVCIKGCKGKASSCGCTRDPIIVQSYMGFKDMNDPLFKAGDLMIRAATLVETDADFEKLNAATEAWNKKADQGNIMAYVSSWGEANPGGGQDVIAEFLEQSRKEVVESAKLLKIVIDCLKLPMDV